MHLLIVGAAGRLGKQITNVAIRKGYQVTCLVRDFYRASALERIGAQLVYGDLELPESLPRALKGISVIIDASISKTWDSGFTVIYRGKLALIEAAQVAKIKKFITFSCLKDFFCSSKPKKDHVKNPFLEIQNEILNELKNSPFEHKNFMIRGFTEALCYISYKSLLTKKVRFYKDECPVSMVSRMDVAKIVIKSLSESYMFQNVKYQSAALGLEWSDTKILTDKRFWTLPEVISLGDKLIGETTQIRAYPKWLFLSALRFYRLFKRTSIQYRMTICSFTGPSLQLSKRTQIIYLTFSKESWNSYYQKPVTLEKALQIFYSNIGKQLKKVGYQKFK